MTAGSKRMSSSSVLPLPLFVIIASLLLLSLIVSSHALKCKCTQSSPKVPCIDGVCEVPSASSSCLMLDHPNSGLHYACSSNANLSEGECVEKKSKSGANVKVCSCFSSDFCNFKIWPGGQEAVFEEEEESASREEEEGNVDERRTANSAAYWPPPRLCAALLCLQMLIAIVVVPLA